MADTMVTRVAALAAHARGAVRSTLDGIDAADAEEWTPVEIAARDGGVMMGVILAAGAPVADGQAEELAAEVGLSVPIVRGLLAAARDRTAAGRTPPL